MLSPLEDDISMRFIGLFAATKALGELSKEIGDRKAISRRADELKSVRDALSRLLKEVER